MALQTSCVAINKIEQRKRSSSVRMSIRAIVSLLSAGKCHESIMRSGTMHMQSYLAQVTRRPLERQRSTLNRKRATQSKLLLCRKKHERRNAVRFRSLPSSSSFGNVELEAFANLTTVQ